MTPQRLRLRLAAARLFARGRSRAWVAARLGVSPATASRWFRTWLDGGAAGLAARRAPGRRSRLTPEQGAAIARMLTRPPRNAGVPADSWSLAAIAFAVERETGVRFHRRHVGRMVRRLGWTLPPVGRYAARAFLRVAFAGPEGVAHALYVRRPDTDEKENGRSPGGGVVPTP